MPRLRVSVLNCRDLEGKDVGGTSDPFVKIKVANVYVKTDVVKKNCNPEWNTVFNLDLPISCNPSLEVVLFEVYDYDRFSSNDLIGKASTSLGTLVKGKSQKFTMVLQNAKKGSITVELLAEDFGNAPPPSNDSKQPVNPHQQTQPSHYQMPPQQQQGYSQPPQPYQQYSQPPPPQYQHVGYPQQPIQHQQPLVGFSQPLPTYQHVPMNLPQQIPQQQMCLPYPTNPLITSTTTTTTFINPPNVQFLNPQN